MTRPYDFYADMLETHTEIGYLLVIAIALAAYNLAIATVLWRWPAADVYLVPGIESTGFAEINWGSTPPPPRVAEAHDPLEDTPTIALPAAALGEPASSALPPVVPLQAPMQAPASAPTPVEPRAESGSGGARGDATSPRAYRDPPAPASGRAP